MSYFVHLLSGLKVIKDKPGSLVMYQCCCYVEEWVSNCSDLLSKKYGKNEAPLIEDILKELTFGHLNLRLAIKYSLCITTGGLQYAFQVQTKS